MCCSTGRKVAQFGRAATDRLRVQGQGLRVEGEGRCASLGGETGSAGVWLTPGVAPVQDVRVVEGHSRRRTHNSSPRDLCCSADLSGFPLKG